MHEMEAPQDMDTSQDQSVVTISPLLNTKESAQVVGVSISSFNRLRAAGLITPVTFPLGIKRVLFSRDDVMRLAERIAAGEGVDIPPLP